ncbi:MAG TPA: thiol peroxidase [Acidobacteriota bacterium]|nr:thiol peroxidase [Acidobacteriota bacterium]HNT18659.1 thiol peroxidase [Acidobacteriota bacterium]HQO21297.1 thiol peroxidase [Acidobacteriota bacterium]HQQ47962.1 thiol peroxidase [Acidobacteriota bacterium]
MERKGVIVFKGNPLTLIGPEIRVGDKAPDFSILSNELKEHNLKDFNGKLKVISVTPSLDTPVCDLQATRFDKEATNLPDDVVALNISCDLPFAMARFCSAKNIGKVRTFSDHRDVSFGTAYGVLIKELRLLARAIFIVDKEDIVRYIEIVPEVTSEPDYAKALSALKSL